MQVQRRQRRKQIRIDKYESLGTTNYLYDGADLIEEVDSSGNVLARYTDGRGAMLRGGDLIPSFPHITKYDFLEPDRSPFPMPCVPKFVILSNEGTLREQ